MNLVNGAQSCNVFWQVGSSATLGTNSTLRGNILAFTSITVGAGLTVDGRALALNGAVTLDTDTIIRPTCADPELSISAPEADDLGSAVPGGNRLGESGAGNGDRPARAPDADWVATVVATNFVTGGIPVRDHLQRQRLLLVGHRHLDHRYRHVHLGPTQRSRRPDHQCRPHRIHPQRRRRRQRATWNPVVSVDIPLAAVAGTYTGTVTFSVA